MGSLYTKIGSACKDIRYLRGIHAEIGAFSILFLLTEALRVIHQQYPNNLLPLIEIMHMDEESSHHTLLIYALLKSSRVE